MELEGQGRARDMPTFGLRASHSRLDPLSDQPGLELSERRHDAKNELALWDRDVDLLLVRNEVHADGTEFG